MCKFFRGNSVGSIIAWVFIGLIGAVVFAFLFGYFVMLLWNWLMPALFGLAIIGYWKAVGIVLLARLIFGGFGHHGKKHSHKNCGNHNEFHYAKSMKSGKCGKNGFSKWNYYDKFWEEEGEKVFDDYIEKQKQNDKK